MKKRLSERISAKLAIPLDAISNDPLLELVGATQARIDHHQGILEYRDERIVVRTRLGAIEIQGAELRVVQMSRRRIVIRGRISLAQLV